MIRSVLASVLAAAVVVFFLGPVRRSNRQTGPSPTSPVPTVYLSPPTPTPTVRLTLSALVEHDLAGVDGNYAVAIKNLKTGETYFHNPHRQFAAASLYKLWVMAAALAQIQNGSLQEEEILSRPVDSLYREFNITPEATDLSQGTVTESVADALAQMITLSDNDSALLLSDRVQLQNIAVFLKKYGFNESHLGEPPQTSAFDMSLFFEKLYHGKLANADNTQKMIELLKKQKVNHKLPKYLPEEVAIAHKTGELETVTHDAGIVFSDSGDYIIVILTESDTPIAAEEKIANISRDVFSHFVN